MMATLQSLATAFAAARTAESQASILALMQLTALQGSRSGPGP